MYKILAFDGGGVRSVFSVRLLQRIQQEIDIVGQADMLAGNSGGAIVVGALAAGYSPEEIVEIFRAESSRIFKDSIRDDIKDLFDLTGAKYDNSSRKKVFERYFGTKRLSDSDKAIVIPSFDLKHYSGRWQPMSFHNFKNSRFKDLSITNAVMASTAAQTYFPVFSFGTSKYSDGGVWANNPSMAALTEALGQYKGGQKVEDVVILNIGTLLNKMVLKGSKNDLGIVDWIRRGLLDLILDSGAMDAVGYYCRGILGSRYHSLNTFSPKKIKLDDIKKIQQLIDLADAVDLTETFNWLEGFWN